MLGIPHSRPHTIAYSPLVTSANSFSLMLNELQDFEFTSNSDSTGIVHRNGNVCRDSGVLERGSGGAFLERWSVGAFLERLSIWSAMKGPS
jgi:hypothetical protein